MATITTSTLSVSHLSASSVPEVRSHARRHVGPQSARALQILRHSIEYLADKFVSDDAPDSSCGKLEAIHLLMDLNKMIYTECPEVTRLSTAVWNWLTRQSSHRNELQEAWLRKPMPRVAQKSRA